MKRRCYTATVLQCCRRNDGGGTDTDEAMSKVQGMARALPSIENTLFRRFKLENEVQWLA